MPGYPVMTSPAALLHETLELLSQTYVSCLIIAPSSAFPTSTIVSLSSQCGQQLALPLRTVQKSSSRHWMSSSRTSPGLLVLAPASPGGTAMCSPMVLNLCWSALTYTVLFYQASSPFGPEPGTQTQFSNPVAAQKVLGLVQVTTEMSYHCEYP